MSDNAFKPVLVIGGLAVVIAAATAYLRRNGYSTIGGDTVVRCRAGHLYTTIWVPGGSLKAVRFGMTRFQYCPVGKHWTLVSPVRDSELTEQDRRIAAEHHDVRVP